ncbi:hypothetical protein [Haloarcula nitratireducens]|uniref:Uncharacterized protein n=1 Tax=Haloarcula nitratireducens TaxID=2487749 RepID=A0AAW4PAJ2_9EURY|nr:hypothetical protein [Halomicroarcula nitratireducens]MBX0294916.1 hypothetical protein [Halomicroarcula nitratireducens]
MIIRLWALAWAARYLKYVPILGWRFSENIVQNLESRMERDVDISDMTVEFEGDDASDVRIQVSVTNELPVDLTVNAVNFRLGYTEESQTVANVLWSEDAHGSPPVNISRSMIESGTEEAVRVERHLPAEGPTETLHVDGSLTTEAWLDVPSTKRIPLGTLERDLPSVTTDLPS